MCIAQCGHLSTLCVFYSEVLQYFTADALQCYLNRTAPTSADTPSIYLGGEWAFEWFCKCVLQSHAVRKRLSNHTAVVAQSAVISCFLVTLNLHKSQLIAVSIHTKRGGCASICLNTIFLFSFVHYSTTAFTLQLPILFRVYTAFVCSVSLLFIARCSRKALWATLLVYSHKFNCSLHAHLPTTTVAVNAIIHSVYLLLPVQVRGRLEPVQACIG